MHFITIRDLRSNSAQIQRQLPQENEMVLTSNGKPIGILFATTGDMLEESLAVLHRARAMSAVSAMQMRSVKSGTARMSLEDINKEIAAERKGRKQK